MHIDLDFSGPVPECQISRKIDKNIQQIRFASNKTLHIINRCLFCRSGGIFLFRKTYAEKVIVFDDEIFYIESILSVDPV